MYVYTRRHFCNTQSFYNENFAIQIRRHDFTISDPIILKSKLLNSGVP